MLDIRVLNLNFLVNFRGRDFEIRGGFINRLITGNEDVQTLLTLMIGLIGRN